MYEDNEKNINWLNIIKKVVIVIIAIVLILSIVSLVKKCSKNDEKPNKPEVVDLSKQFDQLEDATLKYLTKDNLPSTINSSKTIRLKNLINKELLTGITDDNGNKCDTSSSYAEVTRLENNYAVKLSLTCGKNSDYRIIYVGCFANCNGSICKGNEESTDGICEIVPDVNNNNNENTNNNNNTNTNTNINTNKNNKKPTANTNKPSSSTSNNKNNINYTSNNTSNAKYATLYEFKKCTTTPATCTEGEYKNGKCQKTVKNTLYGKVTTFPGETVTKVLGNALTKTTSTGTNVTYKNATYMGTINTTKPATIKNSSTIGYLPADNYMSGGKYYYKKYQCTTGTIEFNKTSNVYKCKVTTPGSSKTSYYCNTGTLKQVDGAYKCVTTTTLPGRKGCADSSYSYNSYNDTCTKTLYDTKYYDLKEGSSTCETMWSKSTSLSGWDRTGKTKTVKE